MIMSVDSITELSEKILDDLRGSGYTPHQKILSERKIAELFVVSPNKVHRALQRLVEQGYLYTKPGDGTYIAEPVESAVAGQVLDNEQVVFDQMSSIVPDCGVEELRILLPIGNDHLQRQVWCDVVDKFNSQYPFIKVTVEFDHVRDFSQMTHDIVFATPYQLYPNFKHFCELEDETDPKDIDPGPSQVGVIAGKRYGLPILRTTTVYFYSPALFERYDVSAEAIKGPIDIFRAGAELEKRSGGKIKGVYYWGFLFHAANSGIIFSHDHGRVQFDKDATARFLKELKPHLKLHHFDHKQSGIVTALSEGQYAVCPFVFNYDLLKRSQQRADSRLELLKLPLDEEGFMLGGQFLGCVNERCRFPEEAQFFLNYLRSPETQRHFVSELPSYLSVLSDVLAEQKQENRFGSGTVAYDYNANELHYQMDEFLYSKYPLTMAMETQKYFLGLQGLEKTIKNLSITKRRTTNE